MKPQSKPSSLGLSLDVTLAPSCEAKLQAVRNSIKQYRTEARQVFGALFEAMAAGASSREPLPAEGDDSRLTVIPNNDRAKVILALAFDKMKSFKCAPYANGGGKPVLRAEIELYNAPVYEVREQVLSSNPTWIPFVWDSMRAKTWSYWMAHDPEFQKATRGWLLMQSSRRLASCAGIGIEFPQATGKPRLDGRSIFLKWDREIGEVEFKIPALDPGRYRTWRNIRDGIWKPGTVTLTETRGTRQHPPRLRVQLTYKPPLKIGEKLELDPEASLSVRWTPDFPESFIRLVAGGDVESLSGVSARDYLSGIVAQSAARDARKRACGSPRQMWGTKIFEAESGKLNNMTRHRECVVDDWCHNWSRKITDCARRKRCATVRIDEAPETMLGHPFQFSKLSNYVKYKCAQLGIDVQ